MANSPRGPFFDTSSGTFAPSIEALAAAWLGDPTYSNSSATKGDYRVVIEDRRAWFGFLELEGNQLFVTLDGTAMERLSCGVAVRTSRDESYTRLSPVSGGTVGIEIPAHFTGIDVWILTDDGTWLDHYYESEYHDAWNSRLGQRAKSTMEVDPLDRALQTGESTRFEFKEWVHLTRHDTKAQQLLRTACAFANTEGGVLFIGVDDNLEPVGIDTELRKAYTEELKQGNAATEDAYLRDLKKLLADGLDPLPRYSTSWITFAQRRILAISIERGNGGPYFLAASGDAYVRTGGNSRKIRHSDLPALRPKPAYDR
jgi:hypothetical protein